MRRVFRYTVTLVALQAVFGAIAFLLADLRLPSILVGLLFFGLVWAAGRAFATEGGGWAGAAAAGLFWQMPGLQGSLRYLSDTLGWTAYDGITDLQDFAMESWHTVLLPQLAALPRGLVDGYYARYYIGLVLLSPCLVAAFTLAATFRRRQLSYGEKVIWE